MLKSFHFVFIKDKTAKENTEYKAEYKANWQRQNKTVRTKGEPPELCMCENRWAYGWHNGITILLTNLSMRFKHSWCCQFSGSQSSIKGNWPVCKRPLLTHCNRFTMSRLSSLWPEHAHSFPSISSKRNCTTLSQIYSHIFPCLGKF